MKRKELNNLFPTSLKSYVKTRFNSNGIMLDSVYKNYDQLIELLDKIGEQQRLQNIEKEDVKYLLDFFDIFTKAITETEQTKQPSLYLVWKWLIQIKEHLKPNRNDCHMIRMMKRTALSYLNNNFDFHPYYKIAVFLNPLYKGLQKFCTEENEIREIHALVKDMMVDDNDAPAPNEIPVNNNNNNLNQNSAPKDIFIDDDVDANLNANSTKETELNLYRQQIINKDNFNLLQWWHEHKIMYPRLYKIAVFIHAIPATSAAAERSFSLAGSHITDKRNSLKPSTADALMFFNRNCDYLEQSLKKD